MIEPALNFSIIQSGNENDRSFRGFLSLPFRREWREPRGSLFFTQAKACGYPRGDQHSLCGRFDDGGEDGGDDPERRYGISL